MGKQDDCVYHVNMLLAEYRACAVEVYVNDVTYMYVCTRLHGGASSGAAIFALPRYCHSPDHTRCFQASVLR